MLTKLTSTCFQIIFLIVVIFLISSCSKSSDQNSSAGGTCTYASFPGTAEFTELLTVASGVEVLFDFTLSDPTAPLNCAKCFNNGKDFHLQWNSSVPTAEWLVSNGIYTGVSLPAVYQEMQTGSCNPYMITFPTVTDAYGY